MYKLIKNGVRRYVDGAIIPNSMDNADWREFQRWVADGNTPDPEDPPPPPTQDEKDAEAARIHEKLSALKSKTPAQVEAWVESNVNNLAEAKDALKTLAVAVCILARRI